MTAGDFRMIGVLTVLLVSATVSAGAQTRSGPVEEIRVPELFAHIGRFRAASDEGAIGRAPSYGGTLTIPVSRRFAADLDYQTSTVIRSTSLPYHLFTYETRRRLIVPSLLYRFGREVVYGFVGGGIGAEFDDSTYRRDYRPEFRPPGLPPSEIPPGIIETSMSDVSRVTSFRGGVVAFPTRRFGMRGDVYMAGWHLGARVGAGYRF